jgi:putative FmdB family regulatory protein
MPLVLLAPGPHSLGAIFLLEARERALQLITPSRRFCMPIYEYKCESCGHELEAIQKFSDAALTDCPSCGKAALKKLISAAGFQLKGSGWYATDFRGGAKPKSSDSGSDSGSSGSGSSSPAGGGCGSGTCGCH